MNDSMRTTLVGYLMRIAGSLFDVARREPVSLGAPRTNRLSGGQYEELLEALLSAFPDRPKLEQMLRLKLDKNLSEICGDGNLRDVIFDLIKDAEAGGWTRRLLDAAIEKQPENPELKSFSESYRRTSG